jgi:adenylate cyclase
VTGSLRIGAWEVDPATNELRRGGETVRLEPKVIEVLTCLAARPGQAVSREELLSAVWPDVVVGDDALTQAIIKLRKALGDDAHDPKYIETISKRGYRLIARVESAKPAAGARNSTSKRLALAAVTTIVVLALAAVIAIPQLSKSIRMPWPIAADTHGGATSSFPIVAVLPLVNLSGDPKREYFSDGVTEDVIDALGRFSGVRVLSRSAVQRLKGQSPSPHALRAELSADYVVQGTVREADGKVRVAVELTDTDRGVLLWSERYDSEGIQLFEIQDRIARNIVGRLHVKLTRLEQERVFTKPTGSLEAYDLALQARALLERDDRAANRQARALLARARELAPEYGEVLVVQGWAEAQRAQFGWIEDPPEGLRRSEALLKGALASADQRSHVRAHAMLGLVYGYQDRHEEELLHTQQAVEMNPSDSVALYRRGSALLWVGRLDEAIAAMETSRRYEPPAGTRINLTLAYHVAGRYREALAEADGLLTRAPQLATLHAARAASLAALGNVEEARREAEEVRRLSPSFRAENYVPSFTDPKLSATLRDNLRKAGL